MQAKVAKSFAKDRAGATAVEFAMLVPIFLALLIGVINSASLVFTIASLNYATEKAARCASLDSTQCGSPSATSAYALSSYAAGSSPTFTYASASCGNLVTAAATFDFNVVIFSTSIPLTSSACFP